MTAGPGSDAAPGDYALWDRLLDADPAADACSVRLKRQKLMTLPDQSELGKLLAAMVARQLYRRNELRHYVNASISLESVAATGFTLHCGREMPSDVSACVVGHLDIQCFGRLRAVSKRVRAATYQKAVLSAIGATRSVRAVQALSCLPRHVCASLLRSCACGGRGVDGRALCAAILEAFGGDFERYRRCADSRTQSAVLKLLDGADVLERDYTRYLRS